MQACLRGTQYVYQGQEVGCANVPKGSTCWSTRWRNTSTLTACSSWRWRRNANYGADDAAALDRAFNSLQYQARDHARIPMPWNGKARYGGFSETSEKAGKAVKESWMKPHPLANEIDIASQIGDPDSVLPFWRKMLRFGREYADALVHGD